MAMGGATEPMLPRRFLWPGSCVGMCPWAGFALRTFRQSFVSLPLSALVPEPRSGVRREAAAWPGCGVACVVCFCGGSVSPFAGVEAGLRLASRACGLRVPLLAANGGGLVAVVVMAFSSRRFQVFLVALACTAVLAWLCLVPVGVVGLALGRPVLLVVPASVLVGCPLVVGVCVVIVVFGLVCLCVVVRCARDAELSRCLACCVAPLVERYNTCLWLLSAWCWLVEGSGEVLPEFFLVGSSGSKAEVHRLVALCSGGGFPELFVVVLDCSSLVSAVAVAPQSLRCAVGLAVPWSRSWVPACDGTGVCGSPTWWLVHGPGWFCLWALDLVEV
ncbi:hypothetical protein Taro_022098 [Colocasia esculenta]|uniref:Uncharacterized protein n=1 Tax=Colocasia esculenta TaxID=4460 RepID=A0A843V0R0_COLES|nr:hypothetical protein [Colocasia esculenta]